MEFQAVLPPTDINQRTAGSHTMVKGLINLSQEQQPLFWSLLSESQETGFLRLLAADPGILMAFSPKGISPNAPPNINQVLTSQQPEALTLWHNRILGITIWPDQTCSWRGGGLAGYWFSLCTGGKVFPLTQEV